jgi:hypothetical protein
MSAETTSLNTTNVVPKIDARTVKTYRKNLRLPKRKNRRADLDNNIQAKLRKLKDLYECDKRHRETIAAEYKKVKDEFVEILDYYGVKEVNLRGTDFHLQLKQRPNYVYSIDVDMQKKELERMKREEEDKGIAKNDPTYYTSPLIRR